MAEIRLPQFGMGMSDGTIIAWHKAVGDRVTKGEVLCEIEAAKTTVEMESPETGVLRRILVGVDENVPVDTIIADIEIEAESRRSASSEVQSSAAINEPPAPTATVRPATQAEPGAQVEPLARRIARELGVDLALVKGSGPGGRILADDVRSHTQQHKQAASPPASATPAPAAPATSTVDVGEFTEIPHTMTRRTIARRLTESKQQVPHFYLKVSCEIDALLELRKRLNESAADKVSVNDLIVRAVALTLREVPDANVSWGEKSTRHYQRVDVAVAVATPRGLVTPIVRDVASKSVRQIASEMKDLAARARESKLKPEEYNGGHVSVSNLGMFGVEEFTAIINPPQALIFAVGAGSQQPVVRADKIEVAMQMTVTVSVDHRAIDGAVAAQALSAFKRLIESPAALAS
jgi:pyruvate dehydrogenase E2 component (dihydrolipoamide acetyltransferase)